MDQRSTDRSYDISQLRANGSHYAAVAFDLPYCLHLPYGHYAVAIEAGRRAVTCSVQLETHRRPAAGRGGFLVPPQKAERVGDRRGAYRYSSVVVYIPLRSSDPEVHGSREQMWRRLEAQHYMTLDHAIRCVNRLLTIYRASTGECHIRPLSGGGASFDHSLALVFIDYRPDERTSPATTVHVPYYYDGDIVPEITEVPSEVESEIRARLASDFQVHLSEDLLLNAHDLLGQGEYKLAVIEAETAFEAALWAHARAYYRREGDRQGQMDAWFDRPFYKAAKWAFKEVFESAGKQFRPGTHFFDMWKEKVWTVRGALVHARVTTASAEQAAEAIDAVEESLEYLIGRPKTRPYRYLFPLDVNRTTQ